MPPPRPRSGVGSRRPRADGVAPRSRSRQRDLCRRRRAAIGGRLCHWGPPSLTIPSVGSRTVEYPHRSRTTPRPDTGAGADRRVTVVIEAQHFNADRPVARKSRTTTDHGATRLPANWSPYITDWAAQSASLIEAGGSGGSLRTRVGAGGALQSAAPRPTSSRGVPTERVRRSRRPSQRESMA